MVIALVVLKLIFLFFSIWFGYVNLTNTILVIVGRRTKDISPQNLALMSFVMTGFIYLQWLM